MNIVSVLESQSQRQVESVDQEQLIVQMKPRLLQSPVKHQRPALSVIMKLPTMTTLTRGVMRAAV